MYLCQRNIDLIEIDLLGVTPMTASTLKHLEGYLSAACNNIELYTRAALFTSQQLSLSIETLWPTV